MDDSSRSGLSLAVVVFLLLLMVGGGLLWLRSGAAMAAVAARQAAEAAAAQHAVAEKDREIARLRQELEEARGAPVTLHAETPTSRAPLADAAAPAAEESRPTTAGVAGDAHASAWLQRVHPQRHAALTPAALHAIAELDLRGCEITDADLAHLAALPGLASLELRGTAVTDAGVAQLAGLRLQTLSLRGTKVGARNLPMLPATLQHLDLTDTQAGVEACRYLRPLPDLHTLKLNRLPIDDAGLEALPPLPRLRHLEVDGSRVTAAGVERLLQRYPSLTRIEMRGVRFAPEVLADLGRRFPGVELVTESGPVPGR